MRLGRSCGGRFVDAGCAFVSVQFEAGPDRAFGLTAALATANWLYASQSALN